MPLAFTSLLAQATGIQDNSFLVEEAYNQDRGVVQHISLFTRESKSGSWAYSFTQEWPLKGQRHQLSYQIPLLHNPGSQSSVTGIGDILLNYRLQVLGKEAERLWIAPRLSVSLPTGRWRNGMGSGSPGFVFLVPASLQLTSKLVTHLNAGITLTPSARNETGARATSVGWTAGGSAIYLASARFNLMLESIVSSTSEVTGPGQALASRTWLLSPGIRWAYNFRSGLQIVPGLAYTIDLDRGSGQSGALVYLSFEHPFKKSAETRT